MHHHNIIYDPAHKISHNNLQKQIFDFPVSIKWLKFIDLQFELKMRSIPSNFPLNSSNLTSYFDTKIVYEPTTAPQSPPRYINYQYNPFKLKFQFKFTF